MKALIQQKPSSIMIYTITEIQYVTNDPEDVEGNLLGLPQELFIEVDDNMGSRDRLEYLSEEVSNRTGFCHCGFTITPEID